MLIEFAVTNYRSIQNRQVLSLFASGQVGTKEMSENLILPTINSVNKPLVGSMVIYGANAAGKSNLLKALSALRFMVSHSNNFKLDAPISGYDPYKGDRESNASPTIFEIDFIAKDGRRYFYLVSFNGWQIFREELWVYPAERKVSRKALLFLRQNGSPIEFGELYKGKKDFLPNPNQMLLSKPGIDEVPALQDAYRFFSSGLFFAIFQNTRSDESLLRMLEKNLSESSDNIAFREMIVSLAQAADTSIGDILVNNDDENLIFPTEMPEYERQKIRSRYGKKIKTIHSVYENGAPVGVWTSALLDESSGTLKFIGLAGIIIDVLQKGSAIIVDELDKNLHPLLTRMLIRLFHSSETNPNHAQLIFSSHDVSLIDRELFRRDQILFVDKSQTGASEITRLSDFTGISKMISLQKWYINGMFGGIPAINSYQIDLKIKPIQPEYA